MATVKEIMDYSVTKPLNPNVLRPMVEEIGASSEYNATLPEEAFDVPDNEWGYDHYFIIRQNGEWVLENRGK